MADNVPTYDDYSDLRRKYMELVVDYSLVVEFNGLGGPDDVGRGPDILAMKLKWAMRAAKGLTAVVEAMDFFANSPDLKDLHNEWPHFVATFDWYSGRHERFKLLRDLAKLWNIHVDGEEVRRGGRPKGSTMHLTRESIVEWLRPYIKSLDAEGKHPTRALVAELAGVVPETLRSRHRDFFTWVELLKASEDSPYN